MIKKIIIFIMFVSVTNIYSQVKIGTTPTTLNANSLLELESTNKGVLFPRVALTGTANVAPLAAHVAGMTIYNTATAGDVTPGLYTNNGTAWVRVTNDASSSNIYSADGTIAANRTVAQTDKTLAFTSTATTGTSHFTVDGTTFNVDANLNRVGIGTAASGFPLEVNGEAKATRLLAYGPNSDMFSVAVGRSSLANTTGNSNVAIGNQAMNAAGNSSNNVGIGSNTLVSRSAGSNNNVAVGYYALGASIAGVSTNNVAIGYNSLTSSSGGGSNTAIGYESGSTITTGSNNVILGASTTGITTGSGNVVIGKNVTGLTAALANNIVLADGVGNERMRVDGSGNVGIGTTAPTNNLMVNSTSQWGGVTVQNTSATTSGAAQMILKGSRSWAFQSNGLTNGNGAGFLQLVDQDASNAVRLSFDTSGKMGLGVTTPTEMLDVSGNVKFSGALIAGSSSGTAGQVLTSAGTGAVPTWTSISGSSIYSADGTIAANRTVAQTDKTLAFTSTATTGTSHFTIDGTTFNVDANLNRVGVGIAAPTSKLHVAGSTATAIDNSTASITLTEAHSTLTVGLTAALTVTLPAASTCSGRVYNIVRTDATSNVLTFSQAISIGNTTFTTSNIPGAVFNIQSNGTNWRLINN